MSEFIGIVGAELLTGQMTSCCQSNYISVMKDHYQ